MAIHQRFKPKSNYQLIKNYIKTRPYQCGSISLIIILLVVYYFFFYKKQDTVNLNIKQNIVSTSDNIPTIIQQETLEIPQQELENTEIPLPFQNVEIEQSNSRHQYRYF
jgi:hypothetical protein